METALIYYAPIANDLLETVGMEQTAMILAQFDRLKLIKSLSFPRRDASSIFDGDFDAMFQKTADFERCLDDALWVIRGRKGTGKSTLYTLFTKHKDNAEKLSRGRLEGIKILSGHGNSNQFRPATDVFSDIQKILNKTETDWLSLWRAYATIYLYQSIPEFEDILKKAKLKPLLTRLQYNFGKEESKLWTSKHTTKLGEFATDQNINGYCRDAISYINHWLKENNQKIWLLYDDLDQDIKENSSWQQEALGGLMRLIYDSNNQNLYNIRFKVFLREDIWASLVFTNKSHLGDDRTLLLQWGKEDFFRLAYRLAVSGSAEFKTFANRNLPLAENELDEADEETLRKALAPLWGLRQKSKNAYVAQWVYTRLTDSSGNTYPRSLTILLIKARKVELEQKQGRSSPSDHLLRWKSLTDGLTAASIERCDALKNEYPELMPFFEQIHRLRSLFREKDLTEIWKETLSDTFPIFDAFVKRLEAIGLLEKKRGSDKNRKFDYAIANLYIDGFVARTPGQRK